MSDISPGHLGAQSLPLRLIVSAYMVLPLLLCTSLGQANMAIGNSVVHFETGDSSRKDIEVSNLGTEPLYVQVEPKVVRNPGDEDETRELIKNPRKDGLLVTPNKMVIAPGASKMMRLVNITGHSDNERIYRITAVPVIGDVKAEQTGLKVLIGYEVLAIVQPGNVDQTVTAKREGKRLHFRNSGNTNVYFREGYQCATPETDLEDCTPLPGKRLYPGNEWLVELPHDLPVRYYQSVGTKNFVETYP